MPRRNTKELIRIEALKLFSEKGFEAVGVREIAAAVGIKESALYRHYKNKRDIFDSLLVWMDGYYMEKMNEIHLPGAGLAESVDIAAKRYAESDMVTIREWTLNVFLFWLKDDEGARFRRMLTMEQFQNGDADNAYQQIFFDSVVGYTTQIFEEMRSQGAIRDYPARTMAIQFYAPIFLLLTMYDRQPEREAEAVEQLKEHVRVFTLAYFA
ncbi:MAG: helix-turn-helix domain-containing protein [bacterium]|nr:helix-turn-helix domain-containing protein [bacterium]